MNSDTRGLSWWRRRFDQRPEFRSTGTPQIARLWWNSRWYALVLVLLAAAPLIWPATPPFPDAPGHIGRYAVQMDLDKSVSLQQFFEFHWALIGNLGADLLIVPLSAIFGLEFSAKLIVICIPLLTTAGLIWISKEVHGTVSPLVAFAIPLVYGFPYVFGFINFGLSISFALLAFAYWLRLTTQQKLVRRFSLFGPIACMIWITHVFGWGVLGLLAFSAEAVRCRDEKGSLKWGIWHAARAVVPLAVPLLPMIVWRMGSAGVYTGGFFDPFSKSYSFIGALRDRWMLWDCFGIGTLLVVFWAAFRQKELGFSKTLLIPAVVLACTFLLLPEHVFGSAYADARIVPIAFMVGLLAIRGSNTDWIINERLAVLASTFALLRLAGNTLSFGIADFEQKERLEALLFMNTGARVLALTGEACPQEWEMPRHFHVASFVIFRRHGFTNDQWQASGAQLLRVKYGEARPFEADPSTFVYSRECLLAVQKRYQTSGLPGRTIDDALQTFPRVAFDYVWILKPPGPFSPTADLSVIWKGKDSILYRIGKLPIAKPTTAKG